MEEEQYGFTQNADMGTAICIVASAIEDARIRDKEIWIEFKEAFEYGTTAETLGFHVGTFTRARSRRNAED
jgi:hypothetical protein